MTSISPGQRVLNAIKSCFEIPVPFFKELPTVRNLAQSFLSGIWFTQGIPRVISLLPTNVEGVLPHFGWISALKPWEKFALTVKDVGTYFEWPEKVVNLWKVKGEWQGEGKGEGKAPEDTRNRWKAANRVAAFAHVTLETVVLIPFKYGLYNLLTLGNWAANLGVTAFGLTVVKDGFTALAAGLNAAAEGVNRERSIKVYDKCQKRIALNGPLLQLQALVQGLNAKKEAPDAEQRKKIDELKAAHLTKKAEEKATVKKRVDNEIGKLKKERDELAAKLAELRECKLQDVKEIAALDQKIQKMTKTIQKKNEKLVRMKIWSDPTPVILDRLREVVDYKVAKNEVKAANAQMSIEKSTVSRWFDICKSMVIIFTNLIVLGIAVVAAPHLGLSAVTIGTLFFLGQWITGIATGVFGLGKSAAMEKYKNDYKLPQTNLLRIKA